MKKSVLAKGCMIAGLLILLSVTAMYLWLSDYYKGGFSYGTWINDVYCTGKSAAEVNKELLESESFQTLVIEASGQTVTLDMEEIDYRISYEEPLQTYLNQQNPYLWIDNLIGNLGHKSVDPQITYDENAVRMILANAGLLTEKSKESRSVYLDLGENGYVLVNEREHVLDEEKMLSLVQEALKQRRESLNLESLGCYEDLPLTNEMEKTVELAGILEKAQDCEIIYTFGDDAVTIDGGAVSGFFETDENGNFVFDESGNIIISEQLVYDYVDQLADTYDTVGAKRTFHATRGDDVIVEGGIYGNLLDRETEKAYLYDAVVNRLKETHTPAYEQIANVQGLDDIGNTYIEVDMTEQKLYYYQDGELLIDTPVVTGNTSLRRGTPTGTNYVYAKQRNRTLRGADYETFVKYWIPVKGAIGIHDSSWRSEYGGTIYQTNGSHGCINTPIDEVSKLYDLVEIGTPCVMFY